MKKCIYSTHPPPRAPHTYDLVVLTSLTHPRKYLLLVLQIRKYEKPKTYQDLSYIIIIIISSRVVIKRARN
jgi:hypothetical protein